MRRTANVVSIASSFALTLLVWSGAAVAQLPERAGETPVPSLAPMIKKVSPAVVNVATKGTVSEQGQHNPLLDDPFFRRYFDVPEQQGQGPQQRPFQSAGSGVIVDAKNGYVITNAHVVENASEVTVTLLDNRNVKAEIVGVDKGSDIAVLKIKSSNLVEISIADSSKMEVGDYVVAIGNPFGLTHTVTSGIISALGRVNINPDARAEAYEDFIQTDAAINPGNSGGALVNLSGQLIGINAAILSQSGGNIGIGFAIPSNMVKSIMEQLIKYGSVKRGMLGIRMRNLSPDVAQSLGLSENTSGVLVAEVVKGTPADKAGVEPGDVILSVNGKSVKTDVELRNFIGLMRIGDKVNISLLREGKPKQLSTTLGQREETTAKNAEEIHHGLQGAELADAGGDGGVTVHAVAPGSQAATNGLRSNDVIIGVGRKHVANLAQLRSAIAGMNAFAVTIKRGNSKIVGVID